MQTQTTVSGASGTTCTHSGLYKASDKKAQYLVLYAAGDLFLKFPGGNGTKSTTWYLVTGVRTTSTTVTDNDGVVTGKEDGGFTGVVAVG